MAHHSYIPLHNDTKRFEIVEHTADVGMKVFGSGLRELFIHAAIGLMSFIVDAQSVTCQRTIAIKLKEDNREELLVAWLNEVLFQFSAHGFLSKEFTVENISEKSIIARISGETIVFSKHKIISEIKAATYHELVIKETAEGLEAHVILDT